MLLGGLLAVEGGLLAAFFDAEPVLDATHAWWAHVLARGGIVMPLAVAVVTASLLFAGPRLATSLEESVALAPRRRMWPVLCLHLGAFAALFALTSIVFEHAPSGGWAALWAIAALAAGSSAAAIALPGRALVAFGRRSAGVLAATAAIGIVAWGAGQVTGTWWHPLGRSTLWMVYHILALFTPEPFVSPEHFVVGTQTFVVEIDPPCSGYQGIGLIWVFLAAYLWVFRQSLRFPRALLLVPLATAAMWLANALRLAALIGIGTVLSREVALGGFHANSGSLLLCAVALGFAWAARRSPFFTRDDALATHTPMRNPTAVYLGPLVALTVTAMAAGTVAHGGFDPLYGMRVVAVAAVLWAYRDERDAWLPRWSGYSWEAVGVGALVFVIWLALEPTPPPASGRTLGDALSALPPAWAGLWLVFRVVGATVTVPIAEELAFRGYLARRLVARDFERVPLDRLSVLAVVGSSVLFGAMHDRLVAGTLAGVAYALACRRRGALGDAVLAHATTNALLAAWVLATRSWALW